MATGVPKTNRKITLLSQNTYAYIYHPPSSVDKATLLFLHGFPSTSADWKFQIPYFKQLGYGLLVPDLLGYGGSSKPLDKEAYMGKKMVDDILAILDHENITGSIVGIAHDWGTYLLSQLAIYNQDRISKYVFVSAPFGGPNKGMNLETLNAINTSTEQMLGYPVFGYWYLFNEETAGKVIGNHWDSFYSLVYPAEPDQWKKDFAPIGALRGFIEADSKAEMASYITPEDMEHHHASFGDDYTAPLNWYKRSLADLGQEEEAELLKQGKIDKKIKKDTLMVCGLKDAVCLPFSAKRVMPESVDGRLTEVDIEAGHWIALEKPDEFNKVLKGFIERSWSVL